LIDCNTVQHTKMSVAAKRERRKTAGKRMTSLVGKAAEEDDAFWGHDTWAEDDSGNDSFHESDEDSVNRKDRFDSDFDDSESDNEDEEMAAGAAEEAELMREERSRKKKSSYVDIAKAGRDLMVTKKKTKGKGRIMGDGINAGIVLNFPGPASGPTSGPTSAAAAGIPSAQQSLQVKAAPSATKQLSAPVSPSKSKPKITLSSHLERRSHHSPPKLRKNRSTARSSEPKPTANKAPVASKKLKRKRYTQEELLLEAVNETEPENERWLLGRKRNQQETERDLENMAMKNASKGKVIQKYHSRRGNLITITFPEMDSVPEILTRSDPPLPETKAKQILCVITGKPAKYKDPQTKLPYFDGAAFKELRRRHAAGEIMVPKEVDAPQVIDDDEDPMDIDEQVEVPAPAPASASASASATTKTNSKPETQTKARQKKSNPLASSKISEAATPKSNGSMSRTETNSIGTPSAVKKLIQPKSPPSSSRRSSRKLKPTSKLLDNIVHGDEKSLAAAGAQTLCNELDLEVPDLARASPQTTPRDTSTDVAKSSPNEETNTNTDSKSSSLDTTTKKEQSNNAAKSTSSDQKAAAAPQPPKTTSSTGIASNAAAPSKQTTGGERKSNSDPSPKTENPVLKPPSTSTNGQATANASGQQSKTSAPKAATKRKSPTKDSAKKSDGSVAPKKKKTRIVKRVVKKYRIVQPDGSVVISTQPPNGASATANKSSGKGSGTLSGEVGEGKVVSKSEIIMDAINTYTKAKGSETTKDS
jgi:vacuolar protein sorting-associated protein 72